jgi:hypothetical protein
MKLSSLLNQRLSILQQAQLANLAFAYVRLDDFSTRIARARLGGEVRLRHPTAETEQYSALLTALEGSQSVIDEHFTEEDIVDLADVIAFLTGDGELDLTFRLEDLADRFLQPLRARLKREGVVFDGINPAIGGSTTSDSAGQARLDEKT